MLKRKTYIIFFMLLYFFPSFSPVVLISQNNSGEVITDAIESDMELGFSAIAIQSIYSLLSSNIPSNALEGDFNNNSSGLWESIKNSWIFSFWTYGLIVLLLLCIGLGIRWYEKKLHRKAIEVRNSKVINDTKTKLFSNITHEFRTPLTVISGMADEIKGNESQKILIKRNARILLNLINQILSISKAETGTLKKNMIHDDIVSYLRYLLESFDFVAKSRDINIVFYAEKEKIEMDFDPEKTQQILSNLLSNAINHVPRGGQILVHVSNQIIDKSKKLILKVKDNGTGIDEKDLPHIFERYFQGEDSSYSRIIGSGIGLALTKELVNILGGNISVKSKLGEGSEFKISLPIEKKINEEPLSVSKALFNDKIKAIDPQDFWFNLNEKEKQLNGVEVENGNDLPVILLIDDNHDVKYYISSILQNDFIVKTAKNGKEGIDKAFELIPDIIITDVMMPEKDGYEVCKLLKEDIRTSHIPLIILTAKVEKKDLIKGLERGADLYLTKPFSKDELMLRLKNIIEMKNHIQSSLSDEKKLGKSHELSKEMAFLKKLNDEIEKNVHEEDVKIVYFARSMGMSRSQLYRKVKALTGYSISVYIRNYKLKKADQMLRTTNFNVSQVALEVGFNDLSYFSTKFKEKYGISPSSIRE